MKKEQRNALLISALGGVLEFYDFIIYALLATYLSQQFFPIDNPTISLLAVFITYAVGYLARPLGGIVFGHFGDTVSRQKTFTKSVLLMALATLGIALLPSYHQIGIAAPFLLTLLRIIQGFSVGGEIPGAVTYISETLPKERGFACGFIFCGLTMGVVFGSLTIALMKASFSPTQMHDWGWRIPFLLGSLLGFASYICRRYLNESASFESISDNLTKLPIKTVIQSHRKQLVIGSMLAALSATIATLFFIYVPAYLSNVIHHPYQGFMWLNAIVLTISSFGHILLGWISDRYSNKKLLLIMCFTTIMFAYPVYYTFAYQHEFIIPAMMMTIIPNVIAFGVVPRVLSDLFPTNVRYTGVAICYNMGFAIFGGLAPVAATILSYQLSWKTAPSIILIGVATLALTSIGISVPHTQQSKNNTAFSSV